MKARALWILLFVVLGAHLPVQAEDTGFCEDYRLEPKYHQIFPQMATASEAIIEQFCSGALTNKRAISDQIAQMSVAAEDRFRKNNTFFFPIRDVNQAINQVMQTENAVPNFLVMPLAQGDGIRFEGEKFRVSEANHVACEALAQANQAGSCREYIMAYAAIYNHAQLLIQKLDTGPVLKYLNIVEQDWENFYQKSRSQTLLERAVNSYFWRKDKQPGEFLRPPDAQWILMHPAVVIENVSEAVEGNQTEEGIMLELVGWNSWRRDKWYQLSGGSIVGVYSERINLDDWAYGLALHFGNVYTIGAVDRDGETGVFISMDVLELFKDKKAYMDSYIGSLK
ncbi:hypothetical protein [Thiohalophilus sp.]|uniref:hypothetical protein n=1 Tax=Thiohalophilus sp. TaxID=3028392 RepID=UPI002ACEB6E9|nr:hypothetical protein [Thiohalophilus sp.]MDZ7803644.1 hypothetical protein [Thiohalophilus sp.]